MERTTFQNQVDAKKYKHLKFAELRELCTKMKGPEGRKEKRCTFCGHSNGKVKKSHREATRIEYQLNEL